MADKSQLRRDLGNGWLIGSLVAVSLGFIISKQHPKAIEVAETGIAKEVQDSLQNSMPNHDKNLNELGAYSDHLSKLDWLSGNPLAVLSLDAALKQDDSDQFDTMRQGHDLAVIFAATNGDFGKKAAELFDVESYQECLRFIDSLPKRYQEGLSSLRSRAHLHHMLRGYYEKLPESEPEMSELMGQLEEVRRLLARPRNEGEEDLARRVREKIEQLNKARESKAKEATERSESTPDEPALHPVHLSLNVATDPMFQLQNQDQAVRIRLVSIQRVSADVPLPPDLSPALLTLKEPTHTWNLISGGGEVGDPRIEVTLDPESRKVRFEYKLDMDRAISFSEDTQVNARLKKWEKSRIKLDKDGTNVGKTKMNEMDRIHDDLAKLVGLPSCPAIHASCYSATTYLTNSQVEPVLSSRRTAWNKLHEKLEQARSEQKQTVENPMAKLEHSLTATAKVVFTVVEQTATQDK